jgi:signal transduction histidine kinase
MKVSNKMNLPLDGLNLESLMETLFYREEFLSIASHELKTPLTSIKLHTQVFKRNSSYSKEKVDRLVDQIDIQSTRLIKIIDDMLDISRIRTGQLVMTKTKFNLSEVVEELLAAQISSKIESNIFINGDRERIIQAISVILNNAARYGRGLPIRVRLVQRKTKIIFSVQDQGYGISPEDQKRIFQRFQRAVPASEVSGIGLGLFIANEIVESHNGKIIVKSEIGQGSTFKVNFKREESL